MLSKNKIKLIQSLNRKKHRDEQELFLVEGNKLVKEALLSKLDVVFLAGTSEFLIQISHLTKTVPELAETDSQTLKKASLLQSPQDALALVRKPVFQAGLQSPSKQLCLALDDIQDPGNLGSILRLAEWFGIQHVFCSPATADVFNPKVVQASMGAVLRIETAVVDIPWFSAQVKDMGLPVYGTFLQGENIYTAELLPKGLLIMGNEGSGISDTTAGHVTHKLFIPSFAREGNNPESLNVAVATAICCSEFRRR